METLTAFVRERAPWPPPNRPSRSTTAPAPSGIWLETTRAKHPYVIGVKAPQPPQIMPHTDVQAVLTVLGRRRRDEKARKQDQADGRDSVRKTDTARRRHPLRAP